MRRTKKIISLVTICLTCLLGTTAAAGDPVVNAVALALSPRRQYEVNDKAPPPVCFGVVAHSGLTRMHDSGTDADVHLPERSSKIRVTFAPIDSLYVGRIC